MTEPEQKKRKILSCTDINSAESFAENFGDIVISRKADLVNMSWAGQAQTSKVVAWIKMISSRFVSLLNTVWRHNEYSLCSLLVDLLVPFVELSDDLHLRPQRMKKGSDVEKLIDMSEMIANIQIKSSAQGSWVMPVIPLSLDTTDSAELFQFLQLIDTHLRAVHNEQDSKGKVDILIADKHWDSPRIIVRGDCNFHSFDSSESFHQLCAEMVNKNAPYGILTSHAVWQFFKLEGKKIRFSRKMDLMKSNYYQFDQDAVEGFCFLLEFLGVDPAVDLEATTEQARVVDREEASKLTSLLNPATK